MTARTRRRLLPLAVLGLLVAGVAVFRRRQLERNASEFHQRYG